MHAGDPSGEGPEPVCGRYGIFAGAVDRASGCTPTIEAVAVRPSAPLRPWSILLPHTHAAGSHFAVDLDNRRVGFLQPFEAEGCGRNRHVPRIREVLIGWERQALITCLGEHVEDIAAPIVNGGVSHTGHSFVEIRPCRLVLSAGQEGDLALRRWSFGEPCSSPARIATLSRAALTATAWRRCQCIRQGQCQEREIQPLRHRMRYFAKLFP